MNLTVLQIHHKTVLKGMGKKTKILSNVRKQYGGYHKAKDGKTVLNYCTIIGKLFFTVMSIRNSDSTYTWVEQISKCTVDNENQSKYLQLRKGRQNEPRGAT